MLARDGVEPVSLPRHFAKVGVEGSNPFARSSFSNKINILSGGRASGHIAFWAGRPPGVHRCVGGCDAISGQELSSLVGWGSLPLPTRPFRSRWPPSVGTPPGCAKTREIYRYRRAISDRTVARVFARGLDRFTSRAAVVSVSSS